MSEHTPGPWRYVRPKLSSPFAYVDDADGRPVCELNDNRHNYVANARLIAAAPDLLDVARRVGAWIGGNLDRDLMSPQTRDIYDAAAVAVAKAEGRTP